MSNDCQGRLVDRGNIEQYPEIENERGRLGDLEANTGIGKKSPYSLFPLVERKSYFTLVKKINCCKADATRDVDVLM